MTTEAALTKLSYLMGRDLSTERVKKVQHVCVGDVHVCDVHVCDVHVCVWVMCMCVMCMCVMCMCDGRGLPTK